MFYVYVYLMIYVQYGSLDPFEGFTMNAQLTYM